MFDPSSESRGARRIGGVVPADAAFLTVGAHHHGQGVPADQALDAALDLGAAGEGRLLLYRYRVDVRSVGRVGQPDAVALGVDSKELQEALYPFRAALLHDVVQGLEPFSPFDFFNVGRFWMIRSSHRFLHSPSKDIGVPRSDTCEVKITVAEGRDNAP